MVGTATEYALAIDTLPVNGALMLYDLSWGDYEKLLQQFGEAPGFRVSYDAGKVQIMPVSFAHEYYAEFLKRVVERLSFMARTKILFFGSATLKRQSKLKGVEPDASFYIQSAAVIGNKINLDLEHDPPPDVIVEVDIHHESLSRFPIYASLGIGEIWHYDDQLLTIYCLQQNQYVARPASRALPMLTSAVLTEFLTLSKSEDQYDTLLAFEEWLRAQQPQ